MKKKVSIIIPVYNAEKYIFETIRSVCQQTYENIEIIIVNDGSTDNSLNIVKSFEFNRDNKIITIDNSGVSVARNIGIENSDGEYISFVDSDDIIEDCMIEELVEALESGNYGMSICGIKMCYLNNKKVKTIDMIPHINSVNNQEEFEKSFHILYESKSYLSPCAKMFRRSIIEQSGVKFKENVNIGEDMLFNYDYLKNNITSVVIDKALYNYKINKDESLTKNYTRKRINNNLFLWKASLDFLKELNVSDDLAYTSIMKYYYVSSILVVQGYLNDLKDCRTIINDIKEDINKNDIFQISCKGNFECIVYNWAFKSKSFLLVWIIAWLRMIIKKIFR